MSAKISWSHYDELLRFDDLNKIQYYIKISEKQNLSIRELRERIKLKEYERLPFETKEKLKLNEELTLIDEIKEPIIINSKSTDINKIKEKALQKLILDDIPSFLKQLGSGYAFIDNEYKIKLGNIYNYIDLLLYNIEFNCYIVIELKVTNLKKEHIGQIEVYMNYIDENLKSINQNKTIGIIICRQNDKYVIKYCSDRRIISKEYMLV